VFGGGAVWIVGEGGLGLCGAVGWGGVGWDVMWWLPAALLTVPSLLHP